MLFIWLSPIILKSEGCSAKFISCMLPACHYAISRLVCACHSMDFWGVVACVCSCCLLARPCGHVLLWLFPTSQNCLRLMSQHLLPLGFCSGARLVSIYLCVLFVFYVEWNVRSFCAVTKLFHLSLVCELRRRCAFLFCCEAYFIPLILEYCVSLWLYYGFSAGLILQHGSYCLCFSDLLVYLQLGWG